MKSENFVTKPDLDPRIIEYMKKQIEPCYFWYSGDLLTYSKVKNVYFSIINGCQYEHTNKVRGDLTKHLYNEYKSQNEFIPAFTFQQLFDALPEDVKLYFSNMIGKYTNIKPTPEISNKMIDRIQDLFDKHFPNWLLIAQELLLCCIEEGGEVKND